MLSSAAPLSGLPSVLPSSGTASSAVSLLHQHVVTRCHRFSSAVSSHGVSRGQTATIAEEPERSASNTIEYHGHELMPAAKPTRIYRSMVIPQARSSPTFFENKYGFPASALGARHYHTGFVLPQRPHAAPSIRMLGTLAHNRLLRGLEDEAEDHPRVAKIQAEYYKELVKTDAEAVVERFETGLYGVNSDCSRYYVEALTKLGKLQSSSTAEEAKDSKDSKRRGFFFGRRNAASNAANNSVVTMRYSYGTIATWSLASLLVSIIGVVVLYIFIYDIIQHSTSAEKQKSIMPENNKKAVTFADVAGADEAKEELQQVVDFLRNVEKYKELGAKIPAGVLLSGPSGCGKTLLARAVAGEADVPFFFASASEFEEMYVGVGASRIRKLFAQARQHEKSIVFIDELDSVGGKREFERNHTRQTLNQLLVEMDGFEQHPGVIIIGATNLPQVLDSALVRPGRFDTHINVSLPDVRGRFAMLQLHVKAIKMAPDVDLKVIARGTSQHTGADLKNLVNHAALRAALENCREVNQRHFDYARDKVLLGPETRSRRQAVPDLRNTAYHEAGHALVGLLTPGCMPVYKATIVPRGPILGMVQSLPDEEKGLGIGKDQYKAQLAMALGGQIGEELAFGKEKITAGASSDLQTVTSIATNMVTKWGMSDKVGHRVVGSKTKSLELQNLVDAEVRALIEEAYDYAKDLLSKNQAKHKALAEALLKYETLDSEEMRDVIAGKKLKREI